MTCASLNGWCTPCLWRSCTEDIQGCRLQNGCQDRLLGWSPFRAELQCLNFWSRLLQNLCGFRGIIPTVVKAEWVGLVFITKQPSDGLHGRRMPWGPRSTGTRRRPVPRIHLARHSQEIEAQMLWRIGPRSYQPIRQRRRYTRKWWQLPS